MMTKAEFIQWIEQFRHIDAVKTIIEKGAWSEGELDKLKETLQNGGKLQMKNDYRRRAAWG